MPRRARPHLRMRGAGDEVRRARVHIGQQTHRVDGPLDALARTEQSPCQQTQPVARRSLAPPLRVRPLASSRREGSPRPDRRSTSKSSMRRRLACSVITTTASAASQTCSSTRRWFGVGCRTHRVGDDDRRHRQRVEHIEDVGAVDARRRCRTRAARSPRRRGSAHRPRRACHHHHRRLSTRRRADPRCPRRRRTARRRPSHRGRSSPAASAAENVAMPHGVGGNVDKDPERATAGHGTTVHEGTTDHDELLTSAQSRRRACEGRRDQ